MKICPACKKYIHHSEQVKVTEHTKVKYHWPCYNICEKKYQEYLDYRNSTNPEAGDILSFDEWVKVYSRHFITQ